jgi:hypothetical protein
MDKTSKLILAAIAVGLFANAISPLLHPARVSAQSSFKCSGELKANAWGGIESMIGGYAVELSCR